VAEICAIEDCGKPVKARGWCSTHSQRYYRTGDPLGTKRWVITGSLEDRFWARVDKEPTCWLWRGSQSAAGYGQVGHDRKILYAHRLAYEMFRGPIPEGMEIDHLCRTHNCVNPDHLELVNRQTNAGRREPT
jgi:hypothetical protein